MGKCIAVDIDIAFWSDKDLTIDERYFYLYLLTNSEMNPSKTYELSFEKAKKESDMNSEQILKVIDKLVAQEKITYNPLKKEIHILKGINDILMEDNDNGEI